MTDVDHARISTERETSEVPEMPESRPGRGLVTPGRVGLGLYLAVLVWYSITYGIPMDRIGQTGWIVIGMVVAKIGLPWRAHLRTFLDWLPLLAALVLYDHTRGIADTLGMPIRVVELVDAERWTFLGAIPTVWLQTHVYDAVSVRWWDVGVALVYFSHFIAPWALAAAFYIWSRPRWVSYIRRVLLLSYAGLLTYIVLPSAPPWYAASAGVIDEPVYRLVGRGWNELGLRSADVWLADAQADANAVAALPSLHAGFALLVAMTLWPLARHWAPRGVLALFPLSMAFGLVYGGEHYVVDVLLGWVYVAVVVYGTWRWERWRNSRAGDRDPAGSAILVEPEMTTGGHAWRSDSR